MGKTNWRTEPVSVEKDLDDLRVGVKGQSNWEIARTPRNVLRYSVVVRFAGGRATNRTRGCQSLPNPDELRMPANSYTAVRPGVLRSPAEMERTQTRR